MVDAVSSRLTGLIKSNVPDIDEEKAEIINYGIRSMLSEISKTIIVLLIAYALGVVNYVIAAIIGYAVYRNFAGGFHAPTHLICLSTSMILIFTNVYFSILITSTSINLYIIYAMIFIFNYIVIYLYAPADVEQKPILSKKLRKKLKRGSFIVVAVIFIFSIFVVTDPVLRNILIFATLAESLAQLPISYKIMRCKHSCETDVLHK